MSEAHSAYHLLGKYDEWYKDLIAQVPFDYDIRRDEGFVRVSPDAMKATLRLILALRHELRRVVITDLPSKTNDSLFEVQGTPGGGQTRPEESDHGT